MGKRRTWKNKPKKIREQAALDRKLKILQRPLIPEFKSPHFMLHEMAGALRSIETAIGGPISQTGGLT